MHNVGEYPDSANPRSLRRGTQIMPILRGDQPDFAGKYNESLYTPVMFSEWPLSEASLLIYMDGVKE